MAEETTERIANINVPEALGRALQQLEFQILPAQHTSSWQLIPVANPENPGETFYFVAEVSFSVNSIDVRWYDAADLERHVGEAGRALAILKKAESASGKLVVANSTEMHNAVKNMEMTNKGLLLPPH